MLLPRALSRERYKCRFTPVKKHDSSGISALWASVSNIPCIGALLKSEMKHSDQGTEEHKDLCLHALALTNFVYQLFVVIGGNGHSQRGYVSLWFAHITISFCVK